MNNDDIRRQAASAVYRNDPDFIRNHLHLNTIDWTTIFETACDFDNVDIVRMLLRDKRVRRDFTRIRGLISACDAENLNVIQYLLNQSCVKVERLYLTGDDYTMDSVSPNVVQLLLNNLHNPRLNVTMLLAVIQDSTLEFHGEYQDVLANKIRMLDAEKQKTTDLGRLKQINKERRLLQAPSLARDEAQICSALLFRDGNVFGCLPTDILFVVNAFL